MIKKFGPLFLLLISLAAGAQTFTPGQVLTADQLNTAFSAKTDNANAAITGGTITGLSSPLPVASGGTGSATANGAVTQLQYLQGGTGSVARTLQSKFQDSVSVSDFAADTTGISLSTSAFQNAAGTFPDNNIAVVNVPQGTFNLGSVSVGSRTMVWRESGNVSYTGTALPGNRMFSKYLGDTTRPWFVGNWGVGNNVTDGSSSDRPSLRIVRDASHSGGTQGGSVNASALSIQNTVGANVQNYENGIVVQVTSNTAQTVATPNISAYQGTTFKEVASTGTWFGANFVARDETKLGTVNSKGGLVGLEVDGVASGPDSNSSRVVLDVIGRGYDASADGSTSFNDGLRVRTAGAGVLSAEPVNLLNGIEVTTGAIGSISTGINVNGFAASNAHIEIQGNGGSGIFKLGSTNATNGNTVGQLNYTGWNSSNAKVNYANVMTQIGSNTAGSENGTYIIQTRRAGTLTTEASFSGGMQVGAPTGGAQGTGSVNSASGYYVNGTKISASQVPRTVLVSGYMPSASFATGVKFGIASMTKAQTAEKLVVLTTGTESCTTAPTVQVLDCGSTDGTCSSSTIVASLQVSGTTATSVSTTTMTNASVAANDQLWLNVSAGTCATPPSIYATLTGVSQ